MKRILLILVILLAAAVAFAAPVFKIGGCTDGYATTTAGKLATNVGQDINVDVGPVFLDLAGDWAHASNGADTLALSYAVGFAKTFGAFTPGLKLTGDQTYGLDGLTNQSGDWLSDLEPTLGFAFGPFGIDLYSDLSFERGYDFLQTMDFSAYLKFKIATLRAGYLFMTEQAASDDVGHPNAPAAAAGHSFYAKFSMTY